MLAIDGEIFALKAIVDDDGTLHVDDFVERGLPPFRRIAFIRDVPAGGSRGGHAHKLQSEYVICVSGGLDVRVEARGRVETIALREPGHGLLLPGATWRDLVNFAPGTIVAVLATDAFDERDYIRDHDAFLAWEVRRDE